MTSGNRFVRPPIEFVGTRPGYANGLWIGHGATKTWSGGDQINPLGSRKRNHWDEHAYSMSASRYYCGQGVITSGGIGYAYSLPGYQARSEVDPNVLIPGLYGAGDGFDNNAKIALINKLRSQIQGSDFNLGVFLAEGRESLETIADASNRIYEAAKYYSNGNYREAARKLTGNSRHPHGGTKTNAASGNWLSLQYGWKPLLQDIQAGAEYLAHLSSVPLSQTYRVSSSRKGPNPNASYAFSAGWGSASNVTHGMIKAVMREVNVIQLIGLTDVASIAWEKVPYSFVADWALPVGDFLSARGLSQSLTGTFVTTYVQRVRVSEPRFTANSQVSMTDFHGETTKLTRTVSSTLQVPLPNFKPLDKILTWQHAANGIALLTGPLRKLLNKPNTHVYTE